MIMKKEKISAKENNLDYRGNNGYGDRPAAVSFSGDTIDTSIMLEPAESYGGEVDYYNIDISGIDILGDKISFSSFRQLEEFHRHLGQYIRAMRASIRR